MLDRGKIRAMKKFLAFVIPTLLALTMGIVGSSVQSSAIDEWYPTLMRSPLTPPAIVFPIAWTVLYILMGISLGILVAKEDMSLVRLWLIQLIVNFLWSIAFFTLRSPLLGLIVILVLDVLVFTYTIYAFGRDKVAAWLFMPYMIWLIFATYLTGYIYLNNNLATGYTITAANTPKNSNNMTQTHFTMPALPYALDALEPTMSAQTLDYHYNKHLKGYIDNLNRLTEGTPYQGMSLEQVVLSSDGAIFNNAAQAWNHALFFDGLTPDWSPMPKRLEDAVVRDFGSVAQFQKEFTAAAQSLFGSGWVWLVEDSNGKLSIVTTPNADTPMAQGLNPLAVIDVWEHAYYIDYRNRRADYIQSWWGLVDWRKADHRLKHQ